MATKTFIDGSSNNAPGDATNWTPSGAPAPGDILLMNSGTMNIGGNGLAGDTLTLGQVQSDSAYTFNLSNGAVLATTTANYFTVSATVNVDGRATATFKESNPSSASYTVNLHAGSTLLGNYALNFSGIKVTAATGATFENDAASVSGGTATIDADVAGTGLFRVPALQGTAGSLEFGGSVAASETVDMAGNPYRVTGNVKLLIDKPQDFHAAVNLSDGTIDLKGLGADSYALNGDTLTLYNAGGAVDTMRLRNTTTNGVAGSSITPLSVVQQGTDVVISAGAYQTPTGTALPLVQPPSPSVPTPPVALPPAIPPTPSVPAPPSNPAPQPPPVPPAHTSAVLVHDVSTGQDVQDTLLSAYVGPVHGIEHQFIDISPDNLNVTSTLPNLFIHTGTGSDAINVSATGGTNVLDGGTGSNFLVGGSGSDTFFVDDRGPTSDIWSTVVGFHSGDAATFFGVTPTGFAFDWENGQGAAGAQGLTLHATAAGKPTASVTLAGFTKADLANGRIGVSFGSNPDSGSYLYVHAT